MNLTYGGVVVSGGGQVLLREPAGHYGGYVWTFPKGQGDPNESPTETALREVLEETGYAGRVLAPIPGQHRGDTSVVEFFLMDAAHPPQPADPRETQSLRWVRFGEAHQLINETKTLVGRDRDLRVLDAAWRLFDGLPAHRRASVQPEDLQERHGMPPRTQVLPLDVHFDAAAMDRIRRGRLPAGQQDPWFLYFSGDRLIVHRSWTGLLIYEARFEPAADGGARLGEVVVNSEPTQHRIEHVDHAIAQLLSLLRNLAGPG